MHSQRLSKKYNKVVNLQAFTPRFEIRKNEDAAQIKSTTNGII
jgi:hypothetical protein